jgi:non-specific serine/threonine protein kinase
MVWDREQLSPVRGVNGWNPEDLDLRRLAIFAGGKIYQRGVAYYEQDWRQSLEELDTERASVIVQGSAPYRVEFTKEEDAIGVSCDCPFATREDRSTAFGSSVCKHIVAASLFLRAYLQSDRPRSWRDRLADVVKAAEKAPALHPPEFLFLSLQPLGESWGIVPYAVPAEHFPVSAATDLKETARVLATADPPLEPVRVPAYENGGGRSYINATHMQSSVIRSLSNLGYYWGRSFGNGSLDLSVIIPMLAGGPIFRGTQHDPLQQPVEVFTEPAHIGMRIDTGEDGGLRLTATAEAGARSFPLDPRSTRRISASPLWLLADETLFTVTDSAAIFEAVRKQPSIEIPADGEAEFLAEELVSLTNRFPLHGNAISWDEPLTVEPTPRLYLREEGKSLAAELRFAYAGFEFGYSANRAAQSVARNPVGGGLVPVVRSIEAEAEWWQRLTSATHGLKRGGRVGMLALRSSTHAIDFLLRKVPGLTAAGCEIFGEDKLAAGRVNRNRPTVSFGVTSGIDWFDVAAVIRFGETEVSLKEIRRAVKKRERFVKLADGTIGEIPPEWVERYQHLFAFGEESEGGLRLNQHHATLIDRLLQEEEDSRSDAEFKKRAQRLRDFSGIKERKLPRHFRGELRPYQIAGFNWLYFLYYHNFGGCLADDMGTGKTIVTLAFLQSLKEGGAKKASLLVVPRSLIFNWEREAERFTPRLRLLNHASKERADDTSAFDHYDLVLTTYGLLRRDQELLKSYEFNYLILDEAQAIKNPAAETAKAVRRLRGAHRLTLTGTPVENNTLELWSQFAFLNPGLLGNIEYFRKEFGARIERDADETAAELLRQLVHPFILRRTKDQVAPELPPRTERQLLCEMEPAQRKIYEQQRDHYRAVLMQAIDQQGMNQSRMKVLEGLLRLRQICIHPRLADPDFRGDSAKFELLFETLETLRAEGHKALVFSQFVGMLKLVSAELKKRGIPFSYLDGKTIDRQERVDQFQNEPSIPFFLISLKAGGVGLNLTAADYVIHIDPWWNPAVEMQATDRTHRIGQDKPVFIYKMIVRDSVEEKIVQLQEQKRALVSKLVSTEAGFFKSLSRDDVQVLFS